MHACNLLELECEADFTELSRCGKILIWGLHKSGERKENDAHLHLYCLAVKLKAEREEREECYFTLRHVRQCIVLPRPPAG